MANTKTKITHNDIEAAIAGRPTADKTEARLLTAVAHLLVEIRDLLEIEKKRSTIRRRPTTTN